MKKMALLILIQFSIFAHGGHEVPGALPPAQNGGVLKKARHIHKGSHKHHHGRANSRDIFFEAEYKNNKIKVYALELEAKKHKSYIVIKHSDISSAKLSVMNPRKEKTIKSSFETQGDFWLADFKKKKARRLMVLVDIIYKDARYKAKVQVERK